MARKKTPAKPISALRFDFVESLENLCNESMLLWQALESVLQRRGKPIPDGVWDILQERHDAFRAALIGRDDDSRDEGGT